MTFLWLSQLGIVISAMRLDYKLRKLADLVADGFEVIA